MKKFATVDEYLADVPASQRAILERLRETVRSVAPEAGEKVSYGIPTFTFHGNLVHYGASKNHLSFYPGSKSVMKKFATELKGFETSSGATIRFKPDKPLSAALIKKIVRARMTENRSSKSSH